MSRRQVTWWRARRWVKANADALTDVEIDGRPAGVPDRPDDPLLLPGFDPWVIAPITRRRRAIPAGRESEVSRTAGWISPVLVVDGVVAGLWEFEARGDVLRMAVRGFGRVPAAVGRGAERHAARYADVLGTQGVEMMWR